MHVREASQSKQLRIDAEDVRFWAEIGERCKRIHYFAQELDKEEEAVSELIKDTPLKYSWLKERERVFESQKSYKSQGDQQAPYSVDAKEDRPGVEAGEGRK